eukprot:1395161-Amorphochlora_amoeboformis.AAC.1
MALIISINRECRNPRYKCSPKSSNRELDLRLNSPVQSEGYESKHAMDRSTLRLSVYPQGNRSAMTVIVIPKESSLSSLVSEAARTLESKETHMCLETGARITDISFIRDGDILMLASPPVEFKGGLGNMDEKICYCRNPSLTQTSNQRYPNFRMFTQGFTTWFKTVAVRNENI